MRYLRRKILVIDDEPTVRENLVLFLEMEGYKAVAAENGEKGVSEALRSPPDLVLCDLMMPILDGFGVLARLRAEPATAHVPFVFLTASAVPDDATTGFVLGADEYVTKPCNLAVLGRIIAQRIEAAGSQDSASISAN